MASYISQAFDCTIFLLLLLLSFSPFCVHVLLYVHAHFYVYVYVCVSVCMCVFAVFFFAIVYKMICVEYIDNRCPGYIFIHICTRAFILTPTFIHSYIHTYIYTYIHFYIYNI
ncbi:hypothetical protein F4703DRAFT_1877384, partial [Phycomyces blakesleeanus]